MQSKNEPKGNEQSNEGNKIINIIFKGVGLAMGIAVAVLSVLKQIETDSAMAMLGIGLACLAISLLQQEKSD